MPSKSIAQQHLMQAAEHGAEFPMAQKLRQSMTHGQLHDFSVGSEAGKPQHVSQAPPSGPSLQAPAIPTQPPVDPGAPPVSPIAQMLKGQSSDIMASNTNALRQSGKNEFDATRAAIQASQQGKPKAPRHTNLGKFLHPRKDGKPHGSGSF